MKSQFIRFFFFLWHCTTRNNIIYYSYELCLFSSSSSRSSYSILVLKSILPSFFLAEKALLSRSIFASSFFDRNHNSRVIVVVKPTPQEPFFRCRRLRRLSLCRLLIIHSQFKFPPLSDAFYIVSALKCLFHHLKLKLQSRKQKKSRSKWGLGDASVAVHDIETKIGSSECWWLAKHVLGYFWKEVLSNERTNNTIKSGTP